MQSTRVLTENEHAGYARYRVAQKKVGEALQEQVLSGGDVSTVDMWCPSPPMTSDKMLANQELALAINFRTSLS